MSRSLPLVVGLAFLVQGTSSAEAQLTYPTVYGSTGNPYGPTQAAYQYQRQYGQPWHGYGGQVAQGNYVVPHSVGYASHYGSHHSGYVGAPIYVTSPFVYGGYTAPGPYIYGLERMINPGAFTSNVAPMAGNLPRLTAITPSGPDLADGLGVIQPAGPKMDPSQRPVEPSGAAARLKSLEKQAFGDEQFRKQQWAKAYFEYRAAVDAAPDRADAHYRLGFVFVAMQHTSSAVRELKRAVFLDPTLPQTGDRLSVLFGPNSQIVRSSILHKVADWLREDIRDPDRLFLFGVLLHYEDDARGREVLEAAKRMSENSGRFTDHIVAFLSQPVAPPNPDAPKPDPELIDLPKLLPQPVAPIGAGPAPAKPIDLPPAPRPPAPLPAVPIPDAELNRPASPPNGLPPLKTTVP